MKFKSLFMYGDSVTITTRTRTGTDAYGDPIYDTSTKTVKGAFSPTDTVEAQDGSHQVIDRPNVLLPPTASVDSDSLVTVVGIDWQVEGTPQAWRSPFSGREFGIKVLLYTTKG